MKNNDKKEKTMTLLEEYKTIDNDILENYNTIRQYHIQNNEYRDIHNGYGVELETGAPTNETRDKIARFLNYKYKMNIEQDSSIYCNNYGMEIITQPYTMDEWLNNKNLIKQFFELLKENDIQTNNTTGLHIHISKKLIGKNDTIRENNINKLILILENFKQTFVKLSKRTNFSYCAFMSQYWGHKTYKDLYTIKNNKTYGHNTCINKDNKTYELRIFNGTTDYLTFMAYLQLTFNLVNIISNDNIDLTQLTFNDIINYNKEYKELIKYCKENKISNNSKIIDKTKIKELLQLKENSKTLKENYNYNKYISKVRQLLIDNMELYNKSKEEYNNNNDLYYDLKYIFTQTYKQNNSIYYQFYSINNLLAHYNTKKIIDLKTGQTTEKRTFNKQYKNDYKTMLDKLTDLIKSKGGVV